MNNGSLKTATGRFPFMIVIALVLLFVMILLPAHPRHVGWPAFLKLPLELPAIALALALLPGVITQCVRLLVVAAAGTLLLLRLADLGSYLAFGRRFNPMVELHLLGDGWNLASASVGRLEAAAVTLFALSLFVVVLVLVYRGLGAIMQLNGRPHTALAGIAATTLLAGLTALAADHMQDKKERHGKVQAKLGPEIVLRIQRMQYAIADQKTFVTELASDPLVNETHSGAPVPLPDFSALQGRDIILAFVESYGRSFVDDERFREAARTRLNTLDGVITDAGLHVRSGWLRSPIRGGRSWLAHASFASGLEINNQARFDRLIASDRLSINRLFAAAGWRTAGLMPAIQLDWPEGAWYGFDVTLDRHTLGYAGEPFAWVSMPDQYTLSAFEKLVRTSDPTPVMAEIALISSHAPWTPLTQMVPWESIGDGSIFDGSHRFGPEPSELWRERERVRDHYALSLDYSLEVLGSYLERYGKGALVIILGDHQPASIIDGWGATSDVPVHLISDDPDLLKRLPAAFWSEGMLPDDDLPSQPMRLMREILAHHFSTPAWPDEQESRGAEPLNTVRP